MKKGCQVEWLGSQKQKSPCSGDYSPVQPLVTAPQSPSGDISEKTQIVSLTSCSIAPNSDILYQFWAILEFDKGSSGLTKKSENWVGAPLPLLNIAAPNLSSHFVQKRGSTTDYICKLYPLVSQKPRPEKGNDLPNIKAMWLNSVSY